MVGEGCYKDYSRVSRKKDCRFNATDSEENGEDVVDAGREKMVSVITSANSWGKFAHKMNSIHMDS